MTTLFDTDVRLRRNHTPWAKMGLVHFMREMALNVPYGDNVSPFDHEVVLKVHYRHAVASRFWWSLEWTGEDEKRHAVDSQEFDLLLWRAAELEMKIRERMKRNETQQDPNPQREGPGGSGSILSESVAIGAQGPAEDGKTDIRRTPSLNYGMQTRMPPVIRQPGDFEEAYMMDEIQFTLEQIKEFCGNVHPSIREPWSRGEYSYSTNGHLIIRIPRHPNIEENPYAPDAEKLFMETGAPSEYVDIPLLPEPVISTCVVCGGAGKVITKHGTFIKCENCDNGNILDVQKLQIQGGSFNVEYLRKLSKLPNCKISIGEAGNSQIVGREKPAWFEFSGGDGLLMPMRD